MKKYSSMKLVCIATRKTYSTNICNNLKTAGIKVQSYLDKDVSFTDYRALMCQVESLYKINGYPEILLLDESTAIADQLCSGLHKDNLRKNQDTFKIMCMNAKHIIMMDANSEDDRLIKLIRHWKPDMRLQRIVNTYQSNKDWNAVIMNEVKWRDDMKADLKEGKTLHIVVTSRSYGLKHIVPILQGCGIHENVPGGYKFYHKNNLPLEDLKDVS